MPTPIEITIKTTSDGTGITQTNAQLDSLNAKVSQSNEVVGLSRREWSRTAGEAVFYIDQVAGKVGGMSKELATGVNWVKELGLSFMYGGGIGAAVGIVSAGIGLIASKLQADAAEAKALQDALVKPFVDTRAELEKLGGSPVFDKMANQLQMTNDQVQSYAKSNDHARTNVLALNDAQNAQTQIQSQLKTAQLELSAATADLADKERLYNESKAAAAIVGAEPTAVAGMEESVARYKAAAAAVADLKAAQDASQGSIDGLTQSIQNNVLVEDRLTRARANDSDTLKALTAQTNAYASAVENLLGNMKGILDSAIGKALMPTDVTELDMQATALGHYADKWDETVRRLKTGNIDQYGADFAARIRAMGMPLDEIVRRFQDFSLFAGGKNMDLLNFDALTSSISEQLDALLGESEVKAKAFAKVWEELSKDKQDALRKLGYEKLSDLDQMKIDAMKGPNFDKSMADIVKTITDTHPSMGVELYWIWPQLPGGGQTSSPTSVPTSGGPPPGYTPADYTPYGYGFAQGGAGMVTRSGTVWLDSGEQFWASGTRSQVPAPGGQVIVNAHVPDNLMAERIANLVIRKLNR